MARTGEHKTAILKAAAKLFRRQGYAATGLAEILARSGAPKGSLYHYFPGGKADIGAAAVRAAGRQAGRTLEALAGEGLSAPDLVVAFARELAGWLAASDYREGCPVATVALEMAPDCAPIADAGRAAYADWRAVVARRLTADGVALDRAERMAAFAIAAIEGGLILARVERCDAPLIAAAEEAAEALRAAIADGLAQSVRPM